MAARSPAGTSKGLFEVCNIQSVEEMDKLKLLKGKIKMKGDRNFEHFDFDQIILKAVILKIYNIFK